MEKKGSNYVEIKGSNYLICSSEHLSTSQCLNILSITLRRSIMIMVMLMDTYYFRDTE